MCVRGFGFGMCVYMDMIRMDERPRRVGRGRVDWEKNNTLVEEKLKGSELKSPFAPHHGHVAHTNNVIKHRGTLAKNLHI